MTGAPQGRSAFGAFVLDPADRSACGHEGLLFAGGIVGAMMFAQRA